jgi:hypothetical protein
MRIRGHLSPSERFLLLFPLPPRFLYHVVSVYLFVRWWELSVSIVFSPMPSVHKVQWYNFSR